MILRLNQEEFYKFLEDINTYKKVTMNKLGGVYVVNCEQVYKKGDDLI